MGTREIRIAVLIAIALVGSACDFNSDSGVHQKRNAKASRNEFEQSNTPPVPIPGGNGPGTDKGGVTLPPVVPVPPAPPVAPGPPVPPKLPEPRYTATVNEIVQDGWIRYAGIGDSISWGHGVAIQCSPWPAVPVQTACPDGQNFPARLAQKLQTVQNTTLLVPAGNGYRVKDVFTRQLPILEANTSVISVYIGTNDVPYLSGTFGEYKESTLDKRIEEWQADYERMIGLIQARAPHAMIVLVNIPNRYYLPNNGVAYLPREVTDPSVLIEIAKRINAHINSYAKKGLRVVDLTCDPVSYDPSLLPDGLHPSAAGAMGLAEKVFQVIRSNLITLPKAECTPYL